MNHMKNKAKSKSMVMMAIFMVSLLAIAMFCVMLSTQTSALNAFEQTTDDIQLSVNDNEQMPVHKISARETFADDNFDCNTINIVLTIEATRQFLNYSPDDFSEIGVMAVNDLMQDSVNYVKEQFKFRQKNGYFRLESKSETPENQRETLVNVEAFKRILSLEIENASRERVFEAIDILREREDIYSAEPNFVSSLYSAPYYAQQWPATLRNLIGYDSMVPFPENIFSGNAPMTVVGIIDSGIQSSHPVLSGRMYRGNTILHKDFISGQVVENPIDYMNYQGQVGHGTQVAGIILAMYPNAQLVSLRTADANGNNDFGRVASAIGHAQTNKIPILNYSAGGYGTSSAIKSALEGYDGLFVTAAGNSGKSNDGYTELGSTATRNKVISVGAIDHDGKRSIWDSKVVDAGGGVYVQGSSNFGSNDIVHIYAPGGKDLVQDNRYIYTTAPNSSYSYFKGTSSASPFVAGTAALIKAIRPELSSAAIKTMIIDNSIDINIDVPVWSSNGKSITGYVSKPVKRLNVFNAVSSAPFNTADISGTNNIKIISIGTDAKSLITGSLAIPSTINRRTVTEIGVSAFSNSLFMTASLPNTLKLIGGSAFSGCLKLKSITIPSSIPNDSGSTVGIGVGAFSGCSMLTIYIPGSSALPNNWFSYNPQSRPVVLNSTLSTDQNINYVSSIKKNISNPNATNGISAPFRLGFNFGGWATSATNAANGIVAFTAANVNNASNGTTLYPIWIQTNHTIVFDTHGGSLIPSQTVFQGLKVIRPSNDPEKAGNAFYGWYKDAGCTTEFNFNTEVITSDTTIHAKWADRHIVTFDTHGGSAIPSQTVMHGQKATYPSPSPTKIGYTFNGWYTDTEYTTLHNFPVDIITYATTIHAKWTVNQPTTYTVSFNTYGGSSVSSQTVTSGQKAQRPNTNPTKDNCTFDNWYTSSSYITLFDFNTAITSATTIHAKWIEHFTTTIIGNNIRIDKINVVPSNGEITIPRELGGKLVTELGNGTSLFTNPSAVTSVIFANNSAIQTIGANAFSGCNKLSQISIPASVTSIAANAFSGCSSSLVASWDISNISGNVYIPNGITEIYASLTGNRAGLTNVILSSTLKIIGSYAFANSSLSQISIPASVQTIGNSAFSGCTGLTQISIPATVTQIQNYAFLGTTGLRNITNKATTPQTINNTTFSGVNRSLITVTVPANSAAAYQTAWTGFNIVPSFDLTIEYWDCVNMVCFSSYELGVQQYFDFNEYSFNDDFNYYLMYEFDCSWMGYSYPGTLVGFTVDGQPADWWQLLSQFFYTTVEVTPVFSAVNTPLEWNPTLTLPNGTQGQWYSTTFAAASRTSTYAVVSGSLPAGLSLNSSTRTISGTITAAAGTYNFTIRATCKASGQTIDKHFTIIVNLPPFIWNPQQLPNDMQGQWYSTTFAAASRTSTYAVISGSLPAGLSLNSSTRTISGTITAAAGTYNFTIRATCTVSGEFIDRQFTIDVYNEPLYPFYEVGGNLQTVTNDFIAEFTYSSWYLIASWGITDWIKVYVFDIETGAKTDLVWEWEYEGYSLWDGGLYFDVGEYYYFEFCDCCGDCDIYLQSQSK